MMVKKVNKSNLKHLYYIYSVTLKRLLCWYSKQKETVDFCNVRALGNDGIVVFDSSQQAQRFADDWIKTENSAVNAFITPIDNELIESFEDWVDSTGIDILPEEFLLIPRKNPFSTAYELAPLFKLKKDDLGKFVVKFIIGHKKELQTNNVKKFIRELNQLSQIERLQIIGYFYNKGIELFKE